LFAHFCKRVPRVIFSGLSVIKNLNGYDVSGLTEIDLAEVFV